MQLHNLFPIPVAFFETDLITDEVLEFVNQLEQRQNQGNTTSTDNFILNNPEFETIKNFIKLSLQEYLAATINPKENIKLNITQSWINYSEPGQYHHKHSHPNSLISGVLYLSSSNEDKIYFYRGGYQQLKIPPLDWNMYNSESWWFEANSGKLVLFPSSLEHMVPQVAPPGPRISLSFNTFPRGVLGDQTELTQLDLRR